MPFILICKTINKTKREEVEIYFFFFVSIDFIVIICYNKILKRKDMKERKRLDINLGFEDLEDNDASASSFGWDFQENAGIYLFINFIKDCKSIKIETRYQDIEIKLNNDTYIFAQAKAIQNIDNTSSKSTKLQNALLSLAKTPSNAEDLLIYISNIPAPITGDEEFFKNNIVPYKSCRYTMKNKINSSLDDCLSKVKEELHKPNISKQKSSKLRILENRLENFNIDKFNICSIYPFTDMNNNRYQKIYDAVQDLLINKIGIRFDRANAIAQKLLDYWQNIFSLNGSKKDKKEKSKSLNKKDLTWPIAVLLSDNDPYEISDCLTFYLDNSFVEEIQPYINLENKVYHERFQFLQRVLNEFEIYKKINIGTDSRERDIEKSFIKNKWEMFKEEFYEVEDYIKNEFLTKFYLYRFIMNNRNLSKIDMGVNNDNK